MTSAVTSLLYSGFLIQEMGMEISEPICPGGVMMRKHGEKRWGGHLGGKESKWKVAEFHDDQHLPAENTSVD